MSNDFSIPAGTAKPVIADLEKALAVSPEPLEDDRIKYKDQDQLNEFWNCVVKKQAYKKELNIRGLRIILRTKSSKEVAELMQYMDDMATNLITTYDYLYSKALLAVSLVQYDQDFLDSGEFKQKLEYIDTLPDVIIRTLIKAAVVFEKEISQMEEEIYNPNF